MVHTSETTWKTICDRCGMEKSGGFEETRFKTIYVPRTEPATNERGMIVGVWGFGCGEGTDLCSKCYEQFMSIFKKFMDE